MLVVAATLGVVAYYWLSRSDEQQKPQVETLALQSIAERKAAAVVKEHVPPLVIESAVPKRQRPIPHSAAQYALKAPSNQPNEVVAEVRADAEAGRPEAMRILAEALWRCKTVPRRSDAEIEDAAAMLSLNIEHMKEKGIVKDVEGGADPVEAAARIAADEKTFRDSCAKIPEQVLEGWKKWMESAAAQGDVRAKEGLVKGLLADMRSPELLDEQKEALREQAIGLLEDQIAAGNCQSLELNLLMDISKDPVKTYVYGNILLDLGAQVRSQFPPDQLQAEMVAVRQQQRKLESGIPEDQLPQAKATLDYIAKNYCGT